MFFPAGEVFSAVIRDVFGGGDRLQKYLVHSVSGYDMKG